LSGLPSRMVVNVVGLVLGVVCVLAAIENVFIAAGKPLIKNRAPRTTERARQLAALYGVLGVAVIAVAVLSD
jgi:hypothetical protein